MIKKVPSSHTSHTSHTPHTPHPPPSLFITIQPDMILISATPRAFFYPLFLGFLYYFLNSPNLEEVKKFIQKYEIDFWLLDSQALTLEYVRKNHRLQQLNNTAATLVRAQMENGIVPSLLNVQESCQVLDIQD
ncbi:MAG: hypothetical protein F6K40_06495 [Okeania sp. SIO3I5]|uniref:hypothetical protein n=1 Tax=Okeania sp. SIO3I5 TaxID=2607805 RepID=UPI0013BA2038|nr:hypothetical protein [Okeania sp. SIO3I5]NEQ35953.1 hypothetical protein [Okeania sp. SIO3I5]